MRKMSDQSPPLGNQEVVRTLPKLDLKQTKQTQIAESWRDASVPNRLTAAYQVGRHLNELNWHFQHLLFFVSRDHQQEADDILGRLLGLSYKFASDPSNSLNVAIRSIRDDSEGWLHSE